MMSLICLNSDGFGRHARLPFRRLLKNCQIGCCLLRCFRGSCRLHGRWQWRSCLGPLQRLEMIRLVLLIVRYARSPLLSLLLTQNPPQTLTQTTTTLIPTHFQRLGAVDVTHQKILTSSYTLSQPPRQAH